MPNYLRFRISPDVTIALGAMVKEPGETMIGEQIELLASHHPADEEMDAYERLLGDAMSGDATLFAREDYVEEAWRIVDPVLQGRGDVQEYACGSWGPPDAQARVAPPGGWENPRVSQRI